MDNDLRTDLIEMMRQWTGRELSGEGGRAARHVLKFEGYTDEPEIEIVVKEKQP